MSSKISCFNGTLYRKTLGRFWPLWGGASAAAALPILYMVMNYLTGSYVSDWSTGDFTLYLYQAASMTPVLHLIYALLCAMAAWSYLMNPRAVGLMHTLPISRTGLFLTNAAAGLTMLYAPYVTAGLGSILVGLLSHSLSLHAVFVTAAVALLNGVTFFGLATLCAMLTGNIFALPVLYGGLNFLSPAFSWLTSGIAHDLFPGAPSGASDLAYKLCPVVSLMTHAGPTSFRAHSGEDLTVSYNGLGYVLLYAAAGLLFLALSWIIYRSRASESAGNVVAHRVLRPVFRYGFGLLFGLAAGWFLYSAFWSGLFTQRVYADKLPMGVFMVLASVIGFYIASMLLEKTLRVFHRSWKGVVTVVSLMILLFVSISVDLGGLASRIPSEDKVETINIINYNDGGGSLHLDAYSPEAVAEVMNFHRAVIRDRDHIRETAVDDRSSLSSIRINYYLKNGGYESYQFHVNLQENSSRVQTEGTFEQAYDAMYRSPAVQLDLVRGQPGGRTGQIYVDTFLNLEDVGILKVDIPRGDPDFAPLVEALEADAREGNLFTGAFPTYRENLVPEVYINLEFSQYNEKPRDWWSTGSSHISLSRSMTHTTKTLVELGIMEDIPFPGDPGYWGWSWEAETFPMTEKAASGEETAAVEESPDSYTPPLASGSN